ncbi:MAG: TlpA family protein disulfide reductase [Candidatus Brocadiales bacterium]|nr:TlpA family protein disulfide reductase [Candidatus Brocadiales bacterium]
MIHNQKLNQYLKIIIFSLLATVCLTALLQKNLLIADTIEAVDVDSLKKEIADSKAEMLIVDFWATFCDHCRKQAPLFSNIYKKYKPEELSIIGVSFDFDKKKLKRFIDKTGIKFPVYLAEEDVSFHYNISSIPTMQIYDRDRNLVRSHIGIVDEEEITQTIESILRVK